MSTERLVSETFEAYRERRKKEAVIDRVHRNGWFAKKMPKVSEKYYRKLIPAAHDAVLCALAERGDVNLPCLRDMYVRTPERDRALVIAGYRDIIAKIDTGEVVRDSEADLEIDSKE